MTFRNSPQLLTALTLAGAVLLAPTAARAQNAGPFVIYDGPLLMNVFPNPCTNEMVTVDGRMVVSIYERTSGSIVHTTFRVVMKGQGSTTDPIHPKKYVLNDEELIEVNAAVVGTSETTQILNHGFIRQGETTDTVGAGIMLGAGDDFRQKTTFHATIVNGTPTAFVDNAEMKCM